jgi:hypothetical protein
MRGVALKVQKRAVEARQAVWIRHALILAGFACVMKLT